MVGLLQCHAPGLLSWAERERPTDHPARRATSAFKTDIMAVSELARASMEEKSGAKSVSSHHQCKENDKVSKTRQCFRK